MDDSVDPKVGEKMPSSHLGLYSEKGGIGQTLLEKMGQHKNASTLFFIRAEKLPPSSTSQDSPYVTFF